MFCKSDVFRKLKLGQVRSQDEWKEAKTHWSNSFAWEEINFQQKQNRATAWFHVELLCRGPKWTSVTEKKYAAAWFWSNILSRGMVAKKLPHHHFFTRKWVFKRKKTRRAETSDFLETCKLVGVLGFKILKRLKQKLELWKRFGAPIIWFSSSSSSFPFSCHLWLYFHFVFVLSYWLWVAKLIYLGLFWTLVWSNSLKLLSFCECIYMCLFYSIPNASKWLITI